VVLYVYSIYVPNNFEFYLLGNNMILYHYDTVQYYDVLPVLYVHRTNVLYCTVRIFCVKTLDQTPCWFSVFYASNSSSMLTFMIDISTFKRHPPFLKCVQSFRIIAYLLFQVHALRWLVSTVILAVPGTQTADEKASKFTLFSARQLKEHSTTTVANETQQNKQYQDGETFHSIHERLLDRPLELLDCHRCGSNLHLISILP
jgi:hypothetical protein